MLSAQNDNTGRASRILHQTFYELLSHQSPHFRGSVERGGPDRARGSPVAGREGANKIAVPAPFEARTYLT